MDPSTVFSLSIIVSAVAAEYFLVLRHYDGFSGEEDK